MEDARRKTYARAVAHGPCQVIDYRRWLVPAVSARACRFLRFHDYPLTTPIGLVRATRRLMPAA